MMNNRKDFSPALFVCLSGVLALPATSNAQVAAIEKGSVLQAKQEVKLRASPPSKQILFFVNKPGEEIGGVKPDEKLTVESTNCVQAPFGEDIWVKVRTDSGNEGWAYYGTKATSGNFKQATSIRDRKFLRACAPTRGWCLRVSGR